MGRNRTAEVPEGAQQGRLGAQGHKRDSSEAQAKEPHGNPKCTKTRLARSQNAESQKKGTSQNHKKHQARKKKAKSEGNLKSRHHPNRARANTKTRF